MLKMHWLIKYYIIAFSMIFLIVFLMERSEPKVNWSNYSKNLKINIEEAILDKNCVVIKKEYDKEYELNFKKNFLGFNVRKDRKLVKGLNLLSYLDYYIKKIDC